MLGQVAHVLAVGGAAHLAWVGVVIAAVLPIALLLSVEAVIRNTGADEMQKRARVPRTVPATPRDRASAPGAGPTRAPSPLKPRTHVTGTRTTQEERFANASYVRALDDALAGRSSQNSVAVDFPYARTTIQNDVRARKKERDLVLN